MAVSCNLTSYAFARPNSIAESEPNNTKEEAQMTTQNNEVAEKVADSDWSGRYYVYGKTNSLDDDWYKVVLTAGRQYLTVSHPDNSATYVELWDSENNMAVSSQYGAGYNVSEFESKGGVYYIHLVGTSETESTYQLYIGTPVFIHEELMVEFDPVKTSGTFTKPFSFKNDMIVPKDSVVEQIVFDGSTSSFSSIRITSSSYSGSVPYLTASSSAYIGSLGVRLKSDWDITFYPKKTVNYVPSMTYRYVFPIYEDTVYQHRPIIKK